jgi:hypothetical protein
MNYKEVELTDGKVVRVYAPPVIKINSILANSFPTPQPPIREAPTVTGEPLRMAIEDDPEYLQELEEHEDKTLQKSLDLHILFALKDETPPEDFSTEQIKEIICLYDESWEPRKGPAGRKLDWIEFDLLANMVDRNRVQVAMNDLISIDLEVADQVGESFPSDMEGETIIPVAESS